MIDSVIISREETFMDVQPRQEGNEEAYPAIFSNRSNNLNFNQKSSFLQTHHFYGRPFDQSFTLPSNQP